MTISKRRIRVFSSFMLALGAVLAFTIPAFYALPQEYRRADSVTALTLMPIRSFAYSLDYTAQNPRGEDSLFTLVGNLINPARVGVTSTSTITANARDIPVLLYHGIVERPDRFSMTPQKFAEQMFALKRAGYHTISLQELYEFIQGTRVLDDKSFVLTFDDGRLDSYYGADPVLKALGFTAVMYIASGDSLKGMHASSTYYLHHNLLQKMLDSGRWELGSHAVQETGGYIPISATGDTGNFLSHKKWLSDQSRLETDEEYRARIVRELTDSKEVIESAFNIPIISMSYPFGDYGHQTSNHPGAEAVINEITRANYKFAFQQVWSNDALFTSNYPHDDPYHLRRIESGTDWSGEELLRLIQNSRAKNLPYKDTFATDAGWKHSWGGVDAGNGQLFLRATTTTTGSLAFLDGTSDWKNYGYKISASYGPGSFVFLVARYRDDDNYMSCWFSDTQVQISAKVDGVMTTVAEIRKRPDLTSALPAFGIEVDGSIIRCLSDSKVVVTARIDERLQTGGIGIGTWDEIENRATASIFSLDAHALPLQ